MNFDFFGIFGKWNFGKSGMSQEEFEARMYGNSNFNQDAFDLGQRQRAEYIRRMNQLRAEQQKSYQQFKQGTSWSQPKEEKKSYGSNIKDWVQTKPPNKEAKQFHFNKLTWKPQFTYENIILQDMRMIDGRDLVKIRIDNNFHETFLNAYSSEIRWERVFQGKYFAHVSKELFEAFIKHEVLPVPMEELI